MQGFKQLKPPAPRRASATPGPPPAAPGSPRRGSASSTGPRALTASSPLPHRRGGAAQNEDKPGDIGAGAAISELEGWAVGKGVGAAGGSLTVIVSERQLERVFQQGLEHPVGGRQERGGQRERPRQGGLCLGAAAAAPSPSAGGAAAGRERGGGSRAGQSRVGPRGACRPPEQGSGRGASAAQRPPCRPPASRPPPALRRAPRPRAHVQALPPLTSGAPRPRHWCGGMGGRPRPVLMDPPPLGGPSPSV